MTPSAHSAMFLKANVYFMPLPPSEIVPLQDRPERKITPPVGTSCLERLGGQGLQTGMAGVNLSAQLSFLPHGERKP
jgi:hypothetical protein